MLGPHWKLVLLALCLLVGVSVASPLIDALRTELELDEDNLTERRDDRDNDLFKKIYKDKDTLMAAMARMLQQMANSRKEALGELPEFDDAPRQKWDEGLVADSELDRLKKRMCRVNLGGHCQTENAASLAKQMHYLNSGLSPGKRRRRRHVAGRTGHT